MMLFLLISPALIGADSKNTYKSGKGLSLPYTCNFETLEIFQTWTIVDVNADGKTWMGVPHVTPPTARCSGLGKNGMNDWLMSPAITLEGGKNIG